MNPFKVRFIKSALVLTTLLSSAALSAKAPPTKLNNFGPAERATWVEILGCGRVTATTERPGVCLDEQAATMFGFLMAVRGSVNMMAPDDPTETCRLIGAIETRRELLRGQIYRLADRINPQGPSREIQAMLWSLGSDFGVLGTSNRWTAVNEYCLNGSPDRFSYKFLKIMYLRYMRETLPLIEKEFDAINDKLKLKLPYNRWDGGGPLNDPAAAEKIFDSWEQH